MKYRNVHHLKTGAQYGKLQVLSSKPEMRLRDKSGKRIAWFLCRCDCGVVRYFRGPRLTSGRTKSCGCINGVPRAECITHTTETRRARKSWESMMARCHNEKTQGYKTYGARGIKVCDRWHTFANFLADMGGRPLGKTIDRYPDMTGNYEPGNCRWATWFEQAANRKNTVWYTAPDTGEKEPLFFMCRRMGLPTYVYTRILNGWDFDKAVNIPIYGHRKPVKPKESKPRKWLTVIAPDTGQEEPLMRMCERLDMDYHLIASRIKRGWSLEKAINEPRWEYKFKD